MNAVQPTPVLLGRQILAYSHPTATIPEIPHTCSPFLLPSGGVVANPIDKTLTTLNFEAVFEPPCPTITIPERLDPLQIDFDPDDLKNHKPFSSSTSPQIYAIAGATVVSYLLVVILFITPRTFYVGGTGGGVSLLGRRGTLGGTYGSNTVIGIGSRPWLQKIAALTLAASLTIVTTDTLRLNEKQYNAGYQDASELSRIVLDGLEIRIVRLVSESFVWLAQTQTLIRLFQRRREKLVIKWTAFVFITLEVIFSILDHFVEQGTPLKPKAFDNSMQALNYLFALSLNIAYAAFVIIWSLRKRRFAFFHPQMHSMPLTSLLSLTAVLIPVIFFILDLSKPDVSGWGSYVRWVGACAASVVVWEWVERIEALEREEKKHGILGREVFDGDEMLDNNPPRRQWPSQSQNRKKGEGFGGGFASGINTRWTGIATAVRRVGRMKVPEPMPLKQLGSDSSQSSSQDEGIRDTGDTIVAARNRTSQNPAAATSPVDREETASAGSTVYMVRYHNTTEPTAATSTSAPTEVQTHESRGLATKQAHGKGGAKREETKTPPYMSRLSRIPRPFRRQRQTPPAVVTAALADQQLKSTTPAPAPSGLLERMHLRKHQQPVQMPSGVIVVPAPPRRNSDSDSDRDEDGVARHQFDDDDSDADDEDRPPAAVRNALRMSAPASPVDECGQFLNAQIPHPATPTIDEALRSPVYTRYPEPGPSSSCRDPNQPTNPDPP